MSDALNRAEFRSDRPTRDESVGGNWRHQSDMEQLAQIRDNNPELFERMGPSARMSLGYYEGAKAAAARLGRDVNNSGKAGK